MQLYHQHLRVTSVYYLPEGLQGVVIIAACRLQASDRFIQS